MAGCAAAGQRSKLQAVESTFPIQVTRTVDPIDADTCRVTARISSGPGGILEPFSPLIRRLAQRSVDADYNRLVARFTP